jgi:hypothetical protein
LAAWFNHILRFKSCPAQVDLEKFDWHLGGFLLFNPHMGSIKKRRKAKINKHKRRKKLRLNRHKKRTWQK